MTSAMPRTVIERELSPSAASSASDEDGSTKVEFKYYDSVPYFPLSAWPGVLQLLASEYRPFLLVITDVNKLEFRRCVEELSANGLLYSYEYLAHYRQLIIKCPNALHSSGGGAIQNWMSDIGRLSKTTGTLYAVQTNENIDPHITCRHIPDINFTISSLSSGERNIIFAEVSNSETWSHVASKVYTTLSQDTSYLGAIILDVKEEPAWHGHRIPSGWDRKVKLEYEKTTFRQQDFTSTDTDAPWGPLRSGDITWHHAIAHATLYVILREDLPYFGDIIHSHPFDHRRRLDIYICMRLCGHSNDYPEPGNRDSVEARLHVLFRRAKDTIVAHASLHQGSTNQSHWFPLPPRRQTPEDDGITLSIRALLERVNRGEGDLSNISLEFNDSEDGSDYIAEEAQGTFPHVGSEDPLEFPETTPESRALVEGLLNDLDIALRVGAMKDAYSRWRRWHRKVLADHELSPAVSPGVQMVGRPVTRSTRSQSANRGRVIHARISAAAHDHASSTGRASGSHSNRRIPSSRRR